MANPNAVTTFEFPGAEWKLATIIERQSSKMQSVRRLTLSEVICQSGQDLLAMGCVLEAE